ncbi:hypothetical protein VTN77DRAFT_8163 [Rasamsonia byssochlamydoides]|uniref:uncharacterized protein n=1 Tax=Rasamsonia byssochlamydoides TaxID=89139 RepID=UPI0037436FCC
MALPSFNFTARCANFLDSFKLRTGSDESLGTELTVTKTSEPSCNDMRFDRDTESDSEESSASSDEDDEVDEEEVIFALDESAMAELPLHLQNIMREIQYERFHRLSRENPNLKIRTDNSDRSPPKGGPIHGERSVSMPPWLATPPDFGQVMNYRRFELEYPALPDPEFSRSLNANARTKQTWSATPASQANAFGKPRAVSAAARFYLNRGTQTTSLPQPQKERKAKKHRRSHKRAKLDNERNGARNSRFSSLALKPVATNVRARVKKSFQKLNKLIKR